MCTPKPTCFMLTWKTCCKTVHTYMSSLLVLGPGSMKLPCQRVVLGHASAPTVSFFPAPFTVLRNLFLFSITSVQMRCISGGFPVQKWSEEEESLF